MEGKNVYELPSLSSKDEEIHLYESMNPQHGNTQDELQAAMPRKISKRSACSLTVPGNDTTDDYSLLNTDPHVCNRGTS